jgi:hypothetical protein
MDGNATFVIEESTTSRNWTAHNSRSVMTPRRVRRKERWSGAGWVAAGPVKGSILVWLAYQSVD